MSKALVCQQCSVLKSPPGWIEGELRHPQDLNLYCPVCDAKTQHEVRNW